MDILHNLIFWSFGASFVAYMYFLIKMMLRIPLKSWFPFGIWSISKMRIILGEDYGSTMRPIYYTAASTFAIGLIFVLSSATKL